MAVFEGLGVAMVTPFKDNKVNYDCAGKIIEHIISGGAEAVVVCGTTGEPATMSKEERREMISFTIDKVNRRAAVIAGCGSNCTADAVKNAVEAQSLGADALLIVTPYYNKCTQGGLIAHYTAINDAVNIPIIMYNVPSRTGVNIQPKTAITLSALNNITAIKEASGNIDQIQELLSLSRGKLDVYSGDDSLTFLFGALGAKGVISVAGNAAPSLMSELADASVNGEYEKARNLQFRIQKLMKAMFCEVNPIPVKYAMNLLGFDAGLPRLPLTEIAHENAEAVKSAMAELGLI